MPPKRFDHHSFSGKRPRGRPPLAASKRKFDALSHVVDKNEMIHPLPKMKSSNHPPPPLPLPVIVPRPIVYQNISIEPKLPMLPKMLNHPVDPETSATATISAVAASAAGGSSSSNPKTPNGGRNQSQYPVQRVLNKLLVEDPMSIVSIGNALPDLSKDLLQSTLDILQVLGYVIKVKMGTSNQKEKDVVAFYTTSNFAKSSESADVTQMAALTDQKLRSTELVKNRIQALQVCNAYTYIYIYFFYFYLLLPEYESYKFMLHIMISHLFS